MGPVTDPERATRSKVDVVGAALSVILLGVYVWSVIRTAWISDDVFITLRCIDNGLQGMGWGFNAHERVQAYTHPLWAMTITPFYAITREPMFTTLFVSINVAMAAVVLFAWRVAATPLNGAAGILLLLSSKAFVDYSTSGLENPLTYLLVVLFYLALVRSGRSLGLVTLLASLLILNRFDLLLIGLPGLVWVLYKERSNWKGLLGFAPLVGWVLFATVYYGSPLPNTFYAKLGAGIPRMELIVQGLHYVQISLLHDPVTWASIVVGVAVGIVAGNGATRALALGIVLYLSYIVWIGGDFMSGRFFAAPFLGAVCCLCAVPLPLLRAGVPVFATAACVTAGLWFAPLPLLTDDEYGSDFELLQHGHGVMDERGYYYEGGGLLTSGLEHGHVTHVFAEEGRALAKGGEAVVTFGAIGMRGYYGGPQLYIVDVNALTDPLLARLPAIRQEEWRIGHFTRALPEGYIESIAAQEMKLVDPSLADAYVAYQSVVRGPLFTAVRWRAIPSYAWLGPEAYGVDVEKYRTAPLPVVR